LIDVQRTDFATVVTQDTERAIQFYGGTLGLPRNPNSADEWPEFETGNLTLAVCHWEQLGREEFQWEQLGREEFTPSSSPIALRVPDVAEARRRLEEAGVEFRGETFDSGVCHLAVFHDPDGNRLILHHRYAPHEDGTKP
jgi:catechol 2,3-dioxygenase-like lactoylglutathione lyase family enzyme